MKTRLNKGRILLVLLVPGLVALDLSNGLLGAGIGIGALPITPGELGRSMMLAASLLVILVKRGPYFRRLQYFFLVALALGILGPSFAFLSTGSVVGFAFDIESLFKILYGPALIVLFAALVLRFNLRFTEVMGAIALWGAIAGFGVVLFKLLGIGEGTYGEFSAAHKGLFLAQNDLGLGMTIALTAACHLLFANKRPYSLLIVVVTIAGMLTLGTRMATLGAFAIPLAVYTIQLPVQRTRRRLLVHVFLGLATVALIAGAATMQFRSISSQSYQLDKFTQLAGGQLTRFLLLNGAFTYVSRRGALPALIGDGALRYQEGVAGELSFKDDRSLAEVDWMDLYGAQGILFATLVYAFYLLFLSRMRALESEGGGATWTLRIMLGLFLLHATLAGHALASPLAAGLIAPALALTWIAYRNTRSVRRLSWSVNRATRRDRASTGARSL